MQKYGLQLRVPKQSASARPPPPPRPSAFGNDDEDDVEQNIAREAAKARTLQKVEEQHKKALEEDPSVFDYDGVYDDMKEKLARPKVVDKNERKPKYIGVLLEKAKQREREQDIIYERKLLKERSKEDHLFADKERFLTGAYKKKLEEQQKWLKEDMIRSIREQKDDVTKKTDLSDFYFGLNKNVAFGAGPQDGSKHKEREEPPKDEINTTRTENSGRSKSLLSSPPPGREDQRIAEQNQKQPSGQTEPSGTEEPKKATTKDAEQSSGQNAEASSGQNAPPASDARYKRSGDDLAAARERYLARKRKLEQQQLENMEST